MFYFSCFLVKLFLTLILSDFFEFNAPNKENLKCLFKLCQMFGRAWCCNRIHNWRNFILETKLSPNIHLSQCGTFINIYIGMILPKPWSFSFCPSSWYIFILLYSRNNPPPFFFIFYLFIILFLFYVLLFLV